MNCTIFEKMVHNYIENSLNDSDREAIKRHTQECVSCRKKLDWMTAFKAESSALKGSLMPLRDLWPGIAASIRATQETQLPQQQKKRWKASRKQLYWGLRIAVLATAGVVFLIAIKTLNKPAGKGDSIKNFDFRNDVGPIAMPSSSGAMVAPNSGEAPGVAQVIQPKSDDLHARSGLMQDGCHCEAAPDILQLIDAAWITDENLPSVRKDKVVSERLYSLASKNSDNFFLHKAAIGEGLLLTDDLAKHYREKYEKNPDDVVWTYFYACTLFYRNRSEAIRLLQRLTSEYPNFPWPNLALAQAHMGADDKKFQGYLDAFLKLCPGSPAAAYLLSYIFDWDFVTTTAGHLRAALAKATDTQSLLSYKYLWYIEGSLVVQNNRDHYWEDIKEDLVRLKKMEEGRSPEFRSLIRAGYRLLEDQPTLTALLEKDQSFEARSQKAELQMKSWLKDNPIPPDEATGEEKQRYWEKRLKMIDVLTREVPEESSCWLERLRALAELRNHPESEFLTAADRVLEFVRKGESIPGLSDSDIWSVSSLYAKRGARLDQVPGLIAEAKSRNRQRTTAIDTGSAPVIPFNRDMQLSQQAEDVWYLLFDAYVRIGRRDEARRCLEAIQSGLAEARNQMLAFRSGLNAVDEKYQKQVENSAANMSSTLALREKRYRETLAQFR
jgi:hypothetical protein